MFVAIHQENIGLVEEFIGPRKVGGCDVHSLRVLALSKWQALDNSQNPDGAKPAFERGLCNAWAKSVKVARLVLEWGWLSNGRGNPASY